jgi:hypothetical protein
MTSEDSCRAQPLCTNPVHLQVDKTSGAFKGTAEISALSPLRLLHSCFGHRMWGGVVFASSPSFHILNTGILFVGKYFCRHLQGCANRQVKFKYVHSLWHYMLMLYIFGVYHHIIIELTLQPNLGTAGPWMTCFWTLNHGTMSPEQCPVHLAKPGWLKVEFPMCGLFHNHP